MPSSILAFSKISQFAPLRSDFSELILQESEPSFDWGFDLESPFEHLGIGTDLRNWRRVLIL